MNMYLDEIYSSELNTARVELEAAYVKLFMTAGGVCRKDGDAYVACVGNDLAVGVTGCGKSWLEAVLDCENNLRFKGKDNE